MCPNYKFYRDCWCLQYWWTLSLHVLQVQPKASTCTCSASTPTLTKGMCCVDALCMQQMDCVECADGLPSFVACLTVCPLCPHTRLHQVPLNDVFFVMKINLDARALQLQQQLKEEEEKKKNPGIVLSFCTSGSPSWLRIITHSFLHWRAAQTALARSSWMLTSSKQQLKCEQKLLLQARQRNGGAQTALAMLISAFLINNTHQMCLEV